MVPQLSHALYFRSILIYISVLPSILHSLRYWKCCKINKPFFSHKCLYDTVFFLQGSRYGSQVFGCIWYGYFQGSYWSSCQNKHILGSIQRVMLTFILSCPVVVVNLYTQYRIMYFLYFNLEIFKLFCYTWNNTYILFCCFITPRQKEKLMLRSHSDMK